MANNEFLDALSPQAEKRLKDYNTEVMKLITEIGKLNGVMANVSFPSQLTTSLNSLNALMSSLSTSVNGLNTGLNNLSNTQTNANTTTRQRNTLTAEEIVNQRILNRNAREQAILTSNLAGAYSQLSTRVAIASRNYQDLMARGRQAGQSQRDYNRELRTARTEFTELNTRVLAADRAVGRFSRNVGNYPKILSGVNNLLGALGVSMGVAGAVGLAKSIFETTRELQSLDLALRNVTGSQEEAATVQAYLAKTAEDYGISVQVLTKSYIGFFAASKNAIESGKISAEQIRDIFGSVSKAAGAMGLSVEQQEGAFLALSQMISKGNVQAEELRGQLSERLPGAFGILAKSMGVTEGQLNKMLKDGKVLAAEVLPAFAKELEKAYGVENLERVETLNASVTRLGNSWTEFVTALNSGDGLFSTAIVGLIEKLSEAVKGAAILLESSESARAKELKTIRQAALDDEMAYYKSLEKIDEAEIMRKRASYLEEIKILQDQVEANNQANSAMLFAANNGQYIEGGAEAIKENAISTKALNMLITSYYGRIAAGMLLLKKETKLLDENTGAKKRNRTYDPEGAILEARLRYLKELADKTQEEYNTEKQLRDRQISETKDIATDEKKLFETRLKAYADYLQKKTDLINDGREFELAQLNKELGIEQEQSEKAKIASLKKAGNNAKAISAINIFYQEEAIKRYEAYDAKVAAINEKSSQEQVALVDETAKAEILIKEKQRELLITNDKMIRDSAIKTYKDIIDEERNALSVRQASFEAMLALQRKQLDLDKIRELSSASGDEYDNIILKYKQLNAELDAMATKGSPVAKAVRVANDALKDLSQTITDGFLSEAGLGSFGQFFDGTFDKIMEGFDNITDASESTAKKLAYGFLVITEAAREMYNLLNKASQENFEQERTNSERKYKIDLLFAGENEAAKAELQKQAEERTRRINKREAKANKDLAKFNIGVSAAQGIVAAFEDGNVVKGAIFAALIAGVAALQISAINAQSIPEYFKGTDNAPGGLAWTQEKGREIITDKHGKIKSTGSDKGAQLTTLAKGDKVYTAEQTRQLMFDNGLNGIMSTNQILPPKNNDFPIDEFRAIGDRMEAAAGRVANITLQTNNDSLGNIISVVANGTASANARKTLTPQKFQR